MGRADDDAGCGGRDAGQWITRGGDDEGQDGQVADGVFEGSLPVQLPSTHDSDLGVVLEEEGFTAFHLERVGG